VIEQELQIPPGEKLFLPGGMAKYPNCRRGLMRRLSWNLRHQGERCLPLVINNGFDLAFCLFAADDNAVAVPGH
jgi:hypothetical protein